MPPFRVFDIQNILCEVSISNLQLAAQTRTAACIFHLRQKQAWKLFPSKMFYSTQKYKIYQEEVWELKQNSVCVQIVL